MALRMIRDLPKDLLSKFNIIHSRVDDSMMSNGKPNILVLHDLPNDPASQHLKDPELRKRFAKIICVSHWQLQMYNVILGLPYQEAIVIPNYIDRMPQRNMVWKPDGSVLRQLRIIYHTTPHRGLALLVPVFEEISKYHPDVVLDVYSSFNIYGWGQRDAQYQPIFDRIKAHPKMKYHGSVPNEEIRKALMNADIFAYPSIWPETSCLAAIEAMSAGVQIVTPGLAALPETTGGFAHMYNYDERTNFHMTNFAQALNAIIEAFKSPAGNQSIQNHAFGQSEYASFRYSKEAVVPLWHQLLMSLAVDHGVQS